MIYLTRTLRLFLTGFCMGSADVVPGVSGGTMAFILGIYDELVDTIQHFGTRELWADVFRGRFRSFLTRANISFIVPIALGILCAVLTLAHSIELLMTERPLELWSVFFGLVLASSHVVYRRIRVWNMRRVILVLIGAVLAYQIVGLDVLETPDSILFLVLSGAVASCAMILPGISGSFLLVILGKYAVILTAVTERDLSILSSVAVGAVLGLLVFSQVLSWLLHHHHDRTVALLLGLMLGSLRTVWPWAHVEASNSASPIFGVVFIASGALAVFVLEYVASRTTRKR